MSSFQCPECQAWCLDGEVRGYTSGCEHYPVPESPGPFLSEAAEFATAEYGIRSQEARLARRCYKYATIYNSGVLALDDNDKVLLLFIVEAWRWRRIDWLTPVSSSKKNRRRASK